MKRFFSFLLYGILGVLGGPISGDPAPGRSPGPPIGTAENVHILPDVSSTLHYIKTVDSDEENSLSNILPPQLQQENINTLNTSPLSQHDEIENENLLRSNSNLVKFASSSPSLTKAIEKTNPEEVNVKKVKQQFNKNPNKLLRKISPIDNKSPCKNSGSNRRGNKNGIGSITTATATGHQPTNNRHIADYLRPTDTIVKLEHDGVIEGSNGKNDVKLSIDSLKLDVTHDVFDTKYGLLPGLIYTVSMYCAPTSTIRDFYIETLINGEPRGIFIDLKKNPYNFPPRQRRPQQQQKSSSSSLFRSKQQQQKRKQHFDNPTLKSTIATTTTTTTATIEETEWISVKPKSEAPSALPSAGGGGGEWQNHEDLKILRKLGDKRSEMAENQNKWYEIDTIRQNEMNTPSPSPSPPPPPLSPLTVLQPQPSPLLARFTLDGEEALAADQLSRVVNGDDVDEIEIEDEDFVDDDNEKENINENDTIDDCQAGNDDNNVWVEKYIYSDKFTMDWTIEEKPDAGKNETVYFRVLFRAETNNNAVYEMIFSLTLLKECTIFLKEYSGSLEYTSLPVQFIDCMVYFPSQLQQEVSTSSSVAEPPGLLVQMTRLNVPCNDGGYIKFFNIDDNNKTRDSGGDNLLCGKLEELPITDRTYYFTKHKNTSIKLHNMPLFSFNYKLVDYCYNVTLIERNQSFFLQPRGALECYFKIHLPYGYRIDMTIITNYNNDSDRNFLYDDDKISSSTIYSSMPIKNDNVDLMNTKLQQKQRQLSSQQQQSSDLALDECRGLLVQLFDKTTQKWIYCYDSFSASKKISFTSSENILVVQVNKLPSSTSSSSSSSSSSSTSSSLIKDGLPSLYVEYTAQSIDTIVSQCAFGWIAVQQFCIAAVETALPWQQAEKECIKKGGHLASIRSKQEQRIIDQFLLNSPGYKDHMAYWIGATDKSFEGDFRWTDSLPFTYANWFPGWSQHENYNKQPNDDGLSGQDCVELRRFFRVPPGSNQPAQQIPLSTSYMWNDRDCEAKNYFLCERPLIDESPVEKAWTEDCNKTIALTREHAKTSVWSPGFPRQYPDNVNCYTLITVPNGYQIIIDFEELVLENEPQCSYDYLELSEPKITSQFFPSSGNSKYQKYPQPLNQWNQPSPSSPLSSLSTGLHHKFFLNTNILNPSDFTNNFPFSAGGGSGGKGDSKKYDLYSPSSFPNNIFNIKSSAPAVIPGDSIEDKLETTVMPRKMCGDWSSKLKLLRYVTKGPALGLHFVSDYSHHYGGYKAKVFMENVASECSDERLKPYNKSCYLFVSYPEVDWWTAQQVCRSIGAQLASVSTVDEQRFITSNIRNDVDYSPRGIYWLGGELSKTGEYEWSDGTEMTYQDWLPGQGVFDEIPKVSTCLGLLWKTSPTPMLPSGLYWAAQKCSSVGGYVCKRSKQSSKVLMIRNQTITGSEGRLTSPGYPNAYPSHVDYVIKIMGPYRTRLIIQFQKIDLEPQEECLYDYVSVKNDLPMDIEPGTNPIPMAMFTDDRDSYDFSNDASPSSYFKRMIFKKRSISDLKDISMTEQTLKEHIKLLETTNRLIKSQLSQRKKRFLGSSITMEEMANKQLHSNGNNSKEHTPTFLPYVRWCGTYEANMSRFDFISKSNQALLHFHSDFSISGTGFSATWTAVDITGCPLQTLTSREGSLNSPNYPHFLLDNMDCTFVIQAPMGKKVWLEFVDFDLVDDAIVKIDLGDGEFRPFSRENLLNDGMYMSAFEKLKVILRTGGQPKGKGFRAIYKTSAHPATEQRTLNLMNTSNGILLHLNYPLPMPPDIDFIQHLIAPLGEIILLELYGVQINEYDCPDGNNLEIYDNYADNNGTSWTLCSISSLKSSSSSSSQEALDRFSSLQSEKLLYDSSLFTSYRLEPAPIFITSYLNTLHIRQRTKIGGTGESTSAIALLNATIKTLPDNNYKPKLASRDIWVESCQPNPCQYGGKCVINGEVKHCECRGHYSGRFCGLTICDFDPCLFGQCELTANNFKCNCLPGYRGDTCDEKHKACADNPCQGRGECFEKNGGGGFTCRCHAWWEGQRCEKKMINIPYKPLSERMLQEPFWLGLITVFVVLAIIGLVWCAKRHFPEKIEKLLAEEADRNRPGTLHSHHTSLREQLQFTSSIPQSTITTPGAPRSIFGRLGIRKPSILSLSSPQPSGGATARTFSLDDLLRPPPRRTPSPRKKRNNSTPTKKNAAEKKQILQQLISPAANQARPKISIGELIQLSENRLKMPVNDPENDVKETTFSENTLPVIAAIPRPLTDPKLEKKVTFARLLNKVSAEISSGSEIDVGNVGIWQQQQHGMGRKIFYLKNSFQGTHAISSVLSLPVEIPQRASSVPPSPCTNDIRSPHSTSSNQGSDSLSGSELALADMGLKNKRMRPKVSSADSILAMFKNFAASSAAANLPQSFVISPSTTPTASSPQDDVPGDDDSSTSSMHTPISFSSGAPDSPVLYRQSTIEVPVLDPLSAHKSIPNTNLLHPPTILLEIPSSNGINKCLSPIREMPTPIPSPALTPIMPRPQRTRTPSLNDDPLSGSFSDDDSSKMENLSQHVMVTLHPDNTRMDSDGDHCSLDTPCPSEQQNHISSPMRRTKFQTRAPAIAISIDVDPPTPDEDKNTATTISSSQQRDIIIPTLMIEQPSPTRDRPTIIMFPGSPPPQRASIGETSFMFPSKQQQKRLLKQLEKPTSLDLPFAPPMITISSNMSEAESDVENMSPAPGKLQPTMTHLGVPGGSVGMCYLSPFSICTRGDRTTSESNLSSSGYSSMASPGPSRCNSNNPLCPSETEDPGTGNSGPSLGLHSILSIRRQNPMLKNCQSNSSTGTANNGARDHNERIRHRSDSETLSDEPLLESNDEGIGTDHLDEKIEEGEIKSAKELELYIGKEFIENGKSLLAVEETITMAQLQLPSIVIQSENGDRALSPVSSRSESPLSERTTGIGRFSPMFYGKKDQQLPFTDSDGLYDFPSSDGKGNTIINHRKSIGKRRDRKSSRSGLSVSPSKTSVHLELPNKEHSGGTHPQSSKYHHTINSTSRKSPKRRPIQRHQVASSSSSSESLISSKEMSRSKLFSSPSKTTCITFGNNSVDIKNHLDSGEEIEENKLCLPSKTEGIRSSSNKLSRLRAIGNQIRFLRRLEQSIKRRDRLISPSDSCNEDNNSDSSWITSPLLPAPTSFPSIASTSSVANKVMRPAFKANANSTISNGNRHKRLINLHHLYHFNENNQKCGKDKHLSPSDIVSD